MSTLSSSAVDPDDVFTSVVDYPGVVSCPALRRLKLGVVAAMDVLCCIECPIVHLLKMSAAPTHAHSHMRNKRAYSTNWMLALFSRYNVYNGRIANLPRPPHPAAPLPFLPQVAGFVCLLCEDVGVQYAVESEDTMANHFTLKHNRGPGKGKHRGGPPPMKAVKVQTFCTTHHTKIWFQVFPELEGPADPEDLHSSPATAQDMLRSAMRSWRPVEHGPVSVSSVKEVQPWLHFNGWVSHTARHDPSFLCGLVEEPEEGTPLARIVAAATREFEGDQSTIPNTAFVYRTEIMDEGNGGHRRVLHCPHSPPKHEFRRLEEPTARDVHDEAEEDGAGGGRAVPCDDDAEPEAVRRPGLEVRRGGGGPSGRSEGAAGHVSVVLVPRHDGGLRAPGGRPVRRPDGALRDLDQHAGRRVVLGTRQRVTPAREDQVFHQGRAVHVVAGHAAAKETACEQVSVTIKERTYHRKLTEHDRPHSIVDSIAPALTRRRLSPFSSTSIAVSLASLYAGTSTHAPNVLWTTPTRSVVEGQDIEFAEFQRAYLKAVEGMEQLLRKSVLLGIMPEDFGLKVGPETTIHDSHARTDVGYSMFSDTRNPFHELRWAMAKGVFEREEGSGLHRGTDEQGNVCWNEGAVERWLDDYAECTRQHAFLMHLSGGQTSRGVEFCLMKVKNMTHRPRNFHWVNPGTLVFLLYYGKGTNQTGMDRVVAHAVPWRLAYTFLVLHGLVNPFASMLVQRAAGDAASYVQQSSAFALHGKEMVSDQLSAECARFFQKGLKVKVGLRVLRQFIVSSQRQMMPEAFGPMQRASNVVDSQAGHDTETALRHYGILAGEHHLFMHNTIQKYIAASQRWWLVLCPEGILLVVEARQGSQAPGRLAQLSIEGPDAPSMERSGPSLSKEDLADAIRDALKEAPLAEFVAGQVARAMIGTHATTTTAATTAPQPNDGTRAEPTLESQPLSEPGPLPLPSPPLPPIPEPEHEHEHEREAGKATRRVVEVKHLAALRLYTGDKAGEWKSRGQSRAFLHALGRESSLLAVLPTGGGKSAVFGAATALESGVTVVITPLRALMLDQTKSLEERGVEVSGWNGDELATPPDGVVVTSLEVAASDRFPRWLARLHAEGRLNRVVVDEVHLLLLSKTYRKAASGLTGLVLHGVPVVGLSATVPPTSEREIRRLLGDPTWRVIREPTQRRNLQLRIAQFKDSKTADKSLQAHVERYRSELESGEGLLVQCRTYADVAHVGKLLGAPEYRRDMSEAERDGNAKDWLEGRAAVIVGTSGMGTGVHHRACRAVLHYKLPYGTVDYAQETGRAGRDGRPALCIIFAPRPTPGAPDVDTGGWEELKEMAEGTECMRLHMSRHLDGEGLETTCAELGGALCSRCAPSMKRIAGRNGAGLSMPEIPDGSEKQYLRAGDWIEEHLPGIAAREDRRPPDQRSVEPRATTPNKDVDAGSADLWGTTPPVPHSFNNTPAAAAAAAAAATGPSTSTAPAQTTQRDEMRRASATAQPAAPIGARISADVEAARARGSAQVNAEVEAEGLLAPLNFPTLMEVKKKMDRR
ncbi:hypothetical protein FRC10_002424, partial [Ceratobasidium sp. 414]